MNLNDILINEKVQYIYFTEYDWILKNVAHRGIPWQMCTSLSFNTPPDAPFTHTASEL